MTGRHRRFAALALALLVGLSGCGRRDTAVARGDRDQVLYRGVGYEAADLDPQRATGIAEQAITATLFEGLVREDAHDLHPVPGVARQWEVSPDGLHYRFHLRTDARWSDGLAVTAADFVAAWRRMLSPALRAENAGLLYPLKGAQAFHLGATSDPGTLGARAVDPQTLDVDLERPTPYFLNLLTHMAWLPVPVRVIASRGPVAARETDWAEAGVLVGNGPFVLTVWSPDREIVVEKSPTYWDAARVRLHAIHFYPIDSLDAEERAFRAGQLHITDAVPPTRIAAYRAKQSPDLRIDPYLATYFYRINVRRPFLDDARIRRALALAVDRRAIVERILQGGQTAAEGFVPPGLPGYTPDPRLHTDYDAARRLLAEAGHPGGRGLPRFVLTFNTSESHRAIAEVVQETWRRELGVAVELRNAEFKTMLAAAVSGDYDLMRASWIADYPDPASFLTVWSSADGNNRTGWSDPAYDALLAQAETAGDSPERLALLHRAENLLLDSAPIIPIFYYTHDFLIQPSVHGWFSTVLDHHPTQEVYLEP